MNILSLPALLLYMELGMIVISIVAASMAYLLMRSARKVVDGRSRPANRTIPYTPLTREKRSVIREIMNV